MKIIKKCKYIKELLSLHLNIRKTIFFNFKVFKLKDAIHFPVLLFGEVFIEDIYRGCVIFENEQRGSLRFGGGWYTDMYGRSQLHKSFLRIAGKLYIGSNITICQGAILSINPGAEVHIGNHVKMNDSVKIHCKEKIVIEDNSRIGWESQIIDTNFHYTITNGMLSYRNGEVYIGHNCWLPNRISVMKGAKLPAYSVVTSMSVINKNLMEYGEKCLFGGIPAKLIRTHTERIINHERELDRYFENGVSSIPYELVKDILDIHDKSEETI